MNWCSMLRYASANGTPNVGRARDGPEQPQHMFFFFFLFLLDSWLESVKIFLLVLLVNFFLFIAYKILDYIKNRSVALSQSTFDLA